MRHLYSKEQVINNTLLGLSYGYDDCCITYFHERQVNGDMIKEIHGGESKRKLNGTGFICCPFCNDKYTENEMLNTINSKRLIDSNFDARGFDDVSDEILSLLIMSRRNEIIELVDSIVIRIEKYIKLEK